MYEMFNYNNYKLNNFFESTLIFYNNNVKVNVKFNYITMHIYTKSIFNFNPNSFYFIDFSNIINQSINNNIFYSTYSRKNWNTLDLFFYNKGKIKTISNFIPVTEWYDRELSEKSTLIILNKFDSRNLLYNYDNKLLTGGYVYKNNYYWTYTNSFKKKVYNNNNLRVVL